MGGGEKEKVNGKWGGGGEEEMTRGKDDEILGLGSKSGGREGEKIKKKPLSWGGRKTGEIRGGGKKKVEEVLRTGGLCGDGGGEIVGRLRARDGQRRCRRKRKEGGPHYEGGGKK